MAISFVILVGFVILVSVVLVVNCILQVLSGVQGFGAAEKNMSKNLYSTQFLFVGGSFFIGNCNL